MGLVLFYAQEVKSGWRYRRVVPKLLKSLVGKKEFIKALGKTRAEALSAYPQVHAEFEGVIHKAERVLAEQTDPKDLPILTRLDLYLEGIAKVRRMGFDPHDATVDPDDPESVMEDNARTSVADVILGD